MRLVVTPILKQRLEEKKNQTIPVGSQDLDNGSKPFQSSDILTSAQKLQQNQDFSVQPKELRQKPEKQQPIKLDFSKVDKSLIPYSGMTPEQIRRMNPTEVTKIEKQKNAYRDEVDAVSKAKEDKIIAEQELALSNLYGHDLQGAIAGKTHLAAASIARGISNLTPAVLYLGDRLRRLTNQELISDEDQRKIIDKSSELSNLGLNPEYRGGDKITKAISGLLEFVPSALAAESSAGTSFYLNGIGSAYKEVQNLKKNGAEFNHGADDLYIQGKGLADYFLMTKLNAHSMFPTLPAELRNVASKEASINALKSIASSGEPLTAQGLTAAFKDSAIKMADNIKSKGVPFLKQLAKGYGQTSADLTALSAADTALKKLSNVTSGEENFQDTSGATGNAIGHILTADAPVFAALGARNNVGMLFDKSPYRNQVVESLKQDASPEAVERLKQDIQGQAQQNGWSADETNGTLSRVDQLSNAVQKIPKNLSETKFNNALDIVLGKENLTEQLNKVKEQNKSIDPALAEVGTPEERALTAKLEQSDDKLKEIATDKKMKYTEQDGEYFKQLGVDGKPEPISKERFELEQVEKEGKDIARLKAEQEEDQNTVEQLKGYIETADKLYDEHVKQAEKETDPVEKKELLDMAEKAKELSDNSKQELTRIEDKQLKQKEDETTKIRERGTLQGSRGLGEEIRGEEPSSRSGSSGNEKVREGKNGENGTGREKESRSEEEVIKDKLKDVVYGTMSGQRPVLEMMKGAELIDAGDGLYIMKDSSKKIAAIADMNHPYTDGLVMVDKSFYDNKTKRWGLPNLANLKDKAKNINVPVDKLTDRLKKAIDILNNELKEKQNEKNDNERVGEKPTGQENGQKVETERGIEEGAGTRPKGTSEVQQEGGTKEKVKEEENAVQKQSSGEVLQREQEETGKAGSGRGGMEQVEQGKETPKQSKSEEEPLGITKAETKKQREYRGEEDLNPSERKTLNEMFEKGKESVDSGQIDPRELASEVSNKPRNLSPDEVNSLLYDRQRLKNEIDNINESMDKAIAEGKQDQVEPLMKRLLFLENQRELNEVAVRSGANVNALALATMRNMIKSDYSRSEQEARMRSKNNGVLTEEMRAEIKKYSDQLEEANRRLKEFEDKRAEELAKKEVEKEVANERKNKKKAEKATLKEERKAIVDDFLAELKKIRSTTSAVSVPYARELAASVPFMRKMLTNLTKEGVVEFKDIIATIHEEFEKHIEGLTTRDVMDVLSGVYNEKKETKNELLAKKNEIIRLSRLTTKLEDLQKGIVKEKSTAKQRTKRQEIIDLEKEIAALEKELGIPLEQRTKESLKRQIERINERIKNEDFVKAQTRPKLELDDELITLRHQVKKAQNNFDAMAERLDKKNESKFNKGLDTYSDINRMFLLSGIKTLGKLYSFAAERAISTPIEEVLNTINRKVPFLSRIAKKSPRYAGGFNPKAEAKAIVQKISKASWKDTYEVLKNGASELDTLYGKAGVDKDFRLNPSALEFFGRLHGAFKNSTKRAEFYRSYEKRLEYAAENGKDINDPNVQFATALEAYGDGKRAILMHDNMLTDAYKSFLRTMESKGNWEGKTVATFFRTILPIIKIPTNYALEAFDTSTFGIRALPYVIKAAIKGSESLTPDQSTMVMRTLAKGQFGAAMMAIAYYNPHIFGGYYSGKRKDDDLKAGDVIINGMHLPHWMTHHPILEAMQIAATMRRAIDAANGGGKESGVMEELTTKNKEKIIELAEDKLDPKVKEPQSSTVNYNGTNYDVWFKNGEAYRITKDNGFRTGLKTGISGLSKQVPFFETPSQLSEGLKSDNKLNKFEGDFLRNRLEPRLLQEAADISDKDADVKFTESPLEYLTSETIKRDPKTILEHLKVGIPILRKQVGEKIQGDAKLRQVKYDDDVYELNSEHVKERQKYIEDFNNKIGGNIIKLMKKQGRTEKDIELVLKKEGLDYSEEMLLRKYKKGDKIDLPLKNQ